MREIAAEQRLVRMRADNPWWSDGRIRPDYAQFRERGYCQRFAELVEQTSVQRAVILMGPRRVGKTVLLHHVIARLMAEGGYRPTEIGYLSLDQPLYSGLSVEDAAATLHRASGGRSGLRVLFLDEIQYLADWERHLKAFVDAHPEVRCIACGSAAAALRRKSTESGAGRFTDFLLPPLTFYEYLDLQQIDGLVERDESRRFTLRDVQGLNAHFIDYINFGAFPEAITSSAVRADPARYIGSDIIEKVLLRDLPSLYGIQDVQELNRLFTLLAYNTAGEVSLSGLSQDSQVSKQTLNRYIEYLEAAFLIKRVKRVDDNARRFKRARNFKIYVTTPSLRTALFGPVTARSSEMGALAETAVFSQWFHSNVELHYARWKSGQREGEVDIVHLDAQQKPSWCVEVKWSDRAARAPRELESLVTFSRKHTGLRGLHLTSRTVVQENLPWPGDAVLNVGPVAFYCYVVGRQGVLDPESRWLPIFSTG